MLNRDMVLLVLSTNVFHSELPPELRLNYAHALPDLLRKIFEIPCLVGTSELDQQLLAYKGIKLPEIPITHRQAYGLNHSMPSLVSDALISQLMASPDRGANFGFTPEFDIAIPGPDVRSVDELNLFMPNRVFTYLPNTITFRLPDGTQTTVPADRSLHWGSMQLMPMSGESLGTIRNAYHGWQANPNSGTHQDRLLDAFSSAKGLNVVPLDLEAPSVGGVLDPVESWSRFIDLLKGADLVEKLVLAGDLWHAMSTEKEVFRLPAASSATRDLKKWLDATHDQREWHAHVLRYLRSRNPDIPVTTREMIGLQSDCYSARASIARPIPITTEEGPGVIRGDQTIVDLGNWALELPGSRRPDGDFAELVTSFVNDCPYLV